MKNLEEFNQGRHEYYQEMLKCQPISSYYNGPPDRGQIACPKCGNELIDTNPDEEHTTYPPKMDIHCSKCKFEGYRIS